MFHDLLVRILDKYLLKMHHILDKQYIFFLFLMMNDKMDIECSIFRLFSYNLWHQIPLFHQMTMNNYLMHKYLHLFYCNFLSEYNQRQYPHQICHRKHDQKIYPVIMLHVRPPLLLTPDKAARLPRMLPPHR